LRFKNICKDTFFFAIKTDLRIKYCFLIRIISKKSGQQHTEKKKISVFFVFLPTISMAVCCQKETKRNTVR